MDPTPTTSSELSEKRKSNWAGLLYTFGLLLFGGLMILDAAYNPRGKTPLFGPLADDVTVLGSIAACLTAPFLTRRPLRRRFRLAIAGTALFVAYAIVVTIISIYIGGLPQD